MITDATQVHSQIIPLKSQNIVLPNTSVAEIIHFRKPKPVDNMPPWLLGTLEWRGLQIPLISIEGATGKTAGDTHAKSRIAVLNTVTGQKDFHFFAVLTQGIPHLQKINKADLKTLESSDKGKFILANVQLDDTRASVPDLEAIESMILGTGIKFKH